jgi:hypothetical protein
MEATPTSLAVSAAIDEFAQLDAELAAMKPKELRHKQLRENLLAVAEHTRGKDPHASLTIESSKHVITFSPREDQRRIVNLGAVKKRLGLPLFMTLVKMTLKNLDAHITTVEQATLGITMSERSGPRDCKVIAKMPVTSVVDLAA